MALRAKLPTGPEKGFHVSAIFEFDIASETLTVDEVKAISGAAHKGDQITWLTKNGWVFHTTRSGNPVVGRLYARLKLSGINPIALSTSGGWVPDFSEIR